MTLEDGQTTHRSLSSKHADAQHQVMQIKCAVFIAVQGKRE